MVTMQWFPGDRDDWERRARWVGEACLLLIPPMLLHARAVAEGAIAVIDLLFLLRCAQRSDWGWVRRPELMAGLVLWAWVVLTTAAGPSPLREVPQALAVARFWVFVPALSQWLLLSEPARRRLWWMVAASAAWIGLQSWEQYLTGRNILGYARWGDGSLTGPIRKPRAGETFVLLAFPAFLPMLVPLLERPARWARIAGGAGVAMLLVTQVLIGQRMPTLLMLLGLAVAGLGLRRLRLPVAAALAVGVALAALTRFVSPPTYYKLVVHFAQQMSHFMATQYAALFERALAMIAAHPWLGLGFDGFRDHCLDAAYRHQLAWFPVADPTSALGCSIHPHNYYLQVATGAGLPGLALFVGLGIAWLWRLGRGAGHSARRLGPFVAAAIVLWPIASTTSFFTLPNVGWILLAIGWGLAEARG